jgi:hypothetical protein
MYKVIVDTSNALSFSISALPSYLSQIHVFYEAVGYMISSQTDTQIREALIVKYMTLPNQQVRFSVSLLFFSLA